MITWTCWIVVQFAQYLFGPHSTINKWQSKFMITNMNRSLPWRWHRFTIKALLKNLNTLLVKRAASASEQAKLSKSMSLLYNINQGIDQSSHMYAYVFFPFKPLHQIEKIKKLYWPSNMYESHIHFSQPSSKEAQKNRFSLSRCDVACWQAQWRPNYRGT